MRRMGIEALYVKPRLSAAHPGHLKYPYLLRGLAITQANQVWSADITYIPMARGFCLPGRDPGLGEPDGALLAAVQHAGQRVLRGRPRRSDHPIRLPRRSSTRTRAASLPRKRSRRASVQRNIAISMDGKGRWMDNVFIERLWKSVKYEEVYLNAYDSMAEARQGLQRYFSILQRTAAAFIA